MFLTFLPIATAFSLGSLLLLLCRWVYLSLWFPIGKLPYPPGPPQQGLLSGNQSDLASRQSWFRFIELGKVYGKILYFRAYNTHTIVLNSYEDSKELLEKRSSIYSDRPYLPVIDLMGWLAINAGFMGYGAEWRSHRRIYQHYFKPDVSLTYQPTQTLKVQEFLYNLLATPADFADHCRTLSAAVIMSVTYAHDVTSRDDYFVDLANKAMSELSQSAPPGYSLFYAFSIIRHIPSWLPGAGFKRAALESKKAVDAMRDVPLGIVREKMRKGLYVDCIAADLLGRNPSKEQLHTIAGVVATSYAAGSDTTVSSMNTFIHAMAMFPEIQARAQDEIDTIVGNERMVTFEDRSALVYVQALQREIMRWRPVLPLSVAHSATSEDVYKGYYIPKGTSVISNIWAISRDPERYPNPHIFDPSRFINENGKLNDDDVGYTFGFGRRICPGRHMASATVWLTIATVLQNFIIEKARDTKGEQIPLTDESTDGLIVHPMPFNCSIVPRSAQARSTILNVVGKLN